jgi:phenylacetate-CoA ligase
MKHLWNDEVEGMPFGEAQAMCAEKHLEEVLKRCMEHSSFYNEKYFKAGVDPLELFAAGRFADIPFTEKCELIEDQVSHPPYGSNVCVSTEKIRRMHRTSGSTGRPLYVLLSEADIRATHEAGARCFWSAGLRPHHTVVHCLNYCMWMGGLSDHMSLEATGAMVIPYGVGNSRGLVDVIKTMGVDVISCTPSYMTRLETIVRNELNMDPRDLGLKLGLFGGEPGIQNQENRKLIEDTWGIKAMDANYGMADVLSMFGAECEARDGLHFHGQGLLHVELIDPETHCAVDVCKGQVGELVLTNISREVQPLVRFRTRDIVEVCGDDMCSCGRGGFRFRVLGRSDDMIHVRGVNVFPSAVANVVSRYMDVFTGEYEIELKNHPPHQVLPLRLESRKGVGHERLNAVKNELEIDVRDELSVSIDCEIVDEGVLGRTEGKKKRVIKSY